MKKFLSLVLALVMTMSLVTIGAGAAEYKDLTDKSEIQYEEAVAVLNKIGIITGYEDGSFKPTGALTRGAAAKIIVSLMIGPEAASNLTVTAAPYSDVPVTNTFAGVISYCKTAGYINGYADGTFRPTAPLTGYAFTKMLLGALGYDGKIEGFTGSGWTMNVAKLGNKAGLFNDFATAFKGNDGINREQACLLALNTLKATEVEYAGTDVSVKGDNIDVTVGNTQYSYVTSNNTKINKNIKVGDGAGLGNNYYTLEFGEEHFQDLKLENARNQTTIEDDYGRPSNKWTLKNVEIGTYATNADYTFTADASGDTNKDKVKNMGLDSYKFDRDTELWINGRKFAVGATATLPDGTEVSLEAGDTTTNVNAKMLSELVKNGTTVQVYLSEQTSNLVTRVVVVMTQVVKINRVSSKDVTFSRVEGSGLGTINAVKDDNEFYSALKGLKADDYVVVTPLYDTGTAYDVDGVYVPTTIKGNISSVKVNGSNLATGLTVGGTAYKMSFNWTVEDASNVAGRLQKLNGSSVSSSRESTLYMDALGYVIYVEDVGASTEHILFDEVYANTVNGRIHYFAQGWDMDGQSLSLDLGTKASDSNWLRSGTVYSYKSANSTSNADYVITGTADSGKITAGTTWKASMVSIDGIYFADNVKYIFVTWEDDTNSDVDTVTVKTGAQEVKGKAVTGTDYQYVTNAAGDKITAVIIKDDSDVEVSQNVMFIQKETNTYLDSDNKTCSIVTAYIDGEKNTDVKINKRLGMIGNSKADKFFTYTKDEASGIYKVNQYSNANSKNTAVISSATLNSDKIQNDAYIAKANVTILSGAPINADNLILSKSTKIIDLRDGGTLSIPKDLADLDNTELTVSFVYNDSSSSSNQGRVSELYVWSTVSLANMSEAPAISVDLNPAEVKYDEGDAASALSVTASGANLKYQWYKDGKAIAGETNATYTPTATGEYYVVVTSKEADKDACSVSSKTTPVTFYPLNKMKIELSGAYADEVTVAAADSNNNYDTTTGTLSVKVVTVGTTNKIKLTSTDTSTDVVIYVDGVQYQNTQVLAAGTEITLPASAETVSIACVAHD